MKFNWRGTPAQAAQVNADWYGPPPLAERSCCCVARPVVRVLIRPAGERRLPADLLLCGHHYLVSKVALAAAGAVVIDETGTVLVPPPAGARTAGYGSGPPVELPDTQVASIEVFP